MKLTDYLGADRAVPAGHDAADQEGPVRRADGADVGAGRCSSASAPDTSWRSSRAATGCLDVTTQFALLGKRTSALFRCLYKGVRLTYSATFISNATATPRSSLPQ